MFRIVLFQLVKVRFYYRTLTLPTGDKVSAIGTIAWAGTVVQTSAAVTTATIGKIGTEPIVVEVAIVGRVRSRWQ